MTVHTIRFADQPDYRPQCQYVMTKPPRRRRDALGRVLPPSKGRGRMWHAACPNVSVSQNSEGLWVCEPHGGAPS